MMTLLRCLPRRFFTVGLFALFGATGAAAEPDLFEMLNRPSYLKAWQLMLTGEKDLEPWLANYATKRRGPVRPGQLVLVKNETYQINDVCKPHDCGDNRFVVLFSPTGNQAWGLWLKAGKDSRYFGHPDDVIRNVLRQGAEGG